MSDTMAHGHVSALASRSDLRARIGWACHGIRIGAVIWIGWALVTLLVNWSDKAKVTEAWGRLLSADLSAVSDARYTAAFAVAVVDLAVAAAVVVCIWQLFGTYLAGRVFTTDAALWLRRTGIAGIASVAVDVVARLAVASILTAQVVPISDSGFYYVMPQDLLNLIFSVFVLALAHIFRAAAEMADDHAQIV